MTDASALKKQLVEFINKNGFDYLIVNSTNEFLVEYNELEQNARYYLTGFAGSTGDVLLSKNGQVHLFVDGRYHKQADKSRDFLNLTVFFLRKFLVTTSCKILIYVLICL